MFCFSPINRRLGMTSGAILTPCVAWKRKHACQASGLWHHVSFSHIWPWAKTWTSVSPGTLTMSGSPFCSCSIIFGGQPAYPHFGPQPYKEMYSLMELPPPIRLSPSIVTTLLLRHVEDLVCDSLTPIAFAHGISDIRPSKSPQKYKCINQKKRKGDKGTSLTQ